MPEENNHNVFSEKVMNEIATGKVKLRSRYVFLAEKLGLSSAFVLSVLLAVLFVCLALFYLSSTDNLVYLSFGQRGFLAFLESFPYLLVVGVIFLIFAAGMILRRSDLSYKKPFSYIAIGLILFVVTSGLALAQTSVADKLEARAYDQRSPVSVLGFFLHTAAGERGQGMAGRIVEIGDGYVWIQTPRSMRKVDLSGVKSFSLDRDTVGSFLVCLGHWDDGRFVAYSAKLLRQGELPVIKRGVHSRFGTFAPDRRLPTPEIKKCLDGCFEQQQKIEICRTRCFGGKVK